MTMSVGETPFSDDAHPLTVMGVTSAHILAVQSAFHATNKTSSNDRAFLLYDLYQQLNNANHDRSGLQWETAAHKWAGRLSQNPMMLLGIRRDHLIALKQAYTHTNKRRCAPLAVQLKSLFEILAHYDRQRDELYWD